MGFTECICVSTQRLCLCVRCSLAAHRPLSFMHPNQPMCSCHCSLKASKRKIFRFTAHLILPSYNVNHWNRRTALVHKQQTLCCILPLFFQKRHLHCYSYCSCHGFWNGFHLLVSSLWEKKPDIVSKNVRQEQKSSNRDWMLHCTFNCVIKISAC